MDEQIEMELGQEAQGLAHEAQREQWISELQEANKQLQAKNKKLRKAIKEGMQQIELSCGHTAYSILEQVLKL